MSANREVAWIDPAAAEALARIAADDDPQAWQDEALCAQADPEAFYPEKGGSTREAKKVCRACDVRIECLEYALEHDERFGIWGGLSERERRRFKRGGPVPGDWDYLPRAS
jgi:WhiB family redox-sensing transcriptional regulator